MSMFSAVIAEIHNEIIKGKGVELDNAIKNQDWDKVKEVSDWLKSEPFSE